MPNIYVNPTAERQHRSVPIVCDSAAGYVER